MELIERGEFLDVLQSKFETISGGEGHCVFVSGEAGIGKTSLIKTFSKEVKGKHTIYQGTCDALFTPRPLAPLYDILLQIGNDLPVNNDDVGDRTAFFTKIFQELKNREDVSILIFEDIHWADDATLDFIKFFARRITQLPCLFILTYRDNELSPGNHLRNIFGQLDRESFTRLPLPPLSKAAVDKVALERGYNGEDVYSISGGNPFYVMEILASYSLGIPDNIRDSILSSYHRLDEKTKHIWEILSVLPTAFNVSYLEKLEPGYADALENCLYHRILIVEKGSIFFKHELYRRTIEGSLSPLVRIALNKKILELFRETFEQDHKIEQIIHHAKNANDYDLVVHYTPIAAKQAAAVGAHTEAAKLYLTAIEYYQGNDKDLLSTFYQAYAYECYLTYQIKDAIIYAGKLLAIWKERNDEEKIGSGLSFLSRLWWLDGNRRKAESLGQQAIEVFSNKPASTAKAMAFSNMSQLKMLYHQPVECIFWGQKAIDMANELGDEGTLCHALNNVGTAKMWMPSVAKEGYELLQQSLELALKNSYHEHAARAYTNIGSNSVTNKNYALAQTILETGIKYCEERDLDSWTDYMLAFKARISLETGHWNEAMQLAEVLVKNEKHAPYIRVGPLIVVATVKMRRGELAEALPLLEEARAKAVETMELQRLIPALAAMLEYEWITGQEIIPQSDIDTTVDLMSDLAIYYEFNAFAFWLCKTRKQKLGVKEIDRKYETDSREKVMKMAQLLEEKNCPYEQAIVLFEGSDEDKRHAITIVQKLSAVAVYEKMKFEMRSSGIKNIPRGIRKTTQSNPALLTERELDVLQLLNEGLQNKEIASRLFISAKTVDHHISSILYKLEVNSRSKAVYEAIRLEIIK